jgi:hypothetical protein
MPRSFIGRTPSLASPFERMPLTYYEPDRGDNPGGGQSGDPAQGYQRLLERHNNDALGMARTLYDENFQYRQRIRDLEGRLPAQGAVVLPAEDAARWQAYQQLGAVDALTQQLQAAQTAQSELTGLRRDAQLRQVAEVAGYKPAVLGRLAGELAMEVREAEGKKSVVVKDGDKETPLAEYAQTHWADFLPALQAGQQQPPQSSGTGFVRQDAGGKSPSSAPDYLKEFQAARDAAVNPLNPKQA